MKTLLRLFFFICICGSVSYSQNGYLVKEKPKIDTSEFGKWPTLGPSGISNDGKYVFYSTKEHDVDRYKLASVQPSWEMTMDRVIYCGFTTDSKRVIIRTTGDSLFMIRAGSSGKKYIGQSTDLIYEPLLKGKQDWLVFKNATNNEELHFRNLQTGREKVVARPDLCKLTPGSEAILFWRNGKDQPEGSLSLVNLSEGKEKIIYSGPQISIRNISFDKTGKGICFYRKEKNDLTSIWYYKEGMNTAEKRFEEPDKGIDDSYFISDEQGLVFNKARNNIFFYLKKKESTRVPKPDAFQVNVWSYSDAVLQSEQLYNKNNNPVTSIAVLDLETNHLHNLMEENEAFQDINYDLASTRDYLLVKRFGGGENIDRNENDYWWRDGARSSVYLVSIKDGTHTLLSENVPYPYCWDMSTLFKLSPGEKFVYYYDPIAGQYFTYEIATKITREISSGATTNWVARAFQRSVPIVRLPAGVAGWLKDDKALWVYDNNDIWQLDPLGVAKPINLTAGYGKSHQLEFRLAMERGELPQDFDPVVGSMVLLSALDLNTKDGGFYRIKIGSKQIPEKLTMDHYRYHQVFEQHPKAKNEATTQVVIRESAEEFPNYFVTEDYKHFRQLTDLHPQKDYKWLTSELIHWKALDGQDNTGILYKPENFDPAKKYPVIFYYFIKSSNQLHEFKWPAATQDAINIPWFVSRGYLVCVPDIHAPLNPDSTIGYESVNSVLSAANFLSGMPWVDSTKLGIQGHSHGGAETIELITHTKKFAAAAEGAGVSDMVSSYLQLTGLGGSRQAGYEIGLGTSSPANGKGFSLWENKTSFIERNNILRVDQVTTPLLMMHNKRDGAVPVEQGIELFLSLRRLGKRVWWLQYDNGRHGVDGKDAVDYTIRMTQFFDHYLKGAPPSKWMTVGIPAKLKGIETGYELDSSGKEPAEQKVLYKGKIQLVRDAVNK